MLRPLRPLLLGLLLGAADLSAARTVETSRFWADLPDGPAASGRSLQLDVAALRDYLRGVPLESAGRPSVLLALPLPGGGFGRFDVVESPIMEPPLQERFSEIRTYRGQGRDERSASVRLDLTPRGFHAMILSGDGMILIDPMVE